MAYLSHSGTSAADLFAANTVRADISDLLLGSMQAENNILSWLRFGQEFGDSVLRWNQDRLNPQVITETTSGGISNSATVMNFSAADAALLDIGYILSDIATSSTQGGIAFGEQIAVTAKNGTAITVTRAANGTTAVAHAQGAQYRMVAKPTIENSDLGPDLSRTRMAAYNYVHRHEWNVNLSSEAILKSQHGFTPGISDELTYQTRQRMAEFLQTWNTTVLVSRASAGTNGTAGQVAGDYATMAGFVQWLDGSWNGGNTVGAGAQPAYYDFAGNGLVAGQVDVALNAVYKALVKQGGNPDWAFAGPSVIEDFSRLYSDRIRLQQDETTRGFVATYFRTSLARELRLLMDVIIQDTAPGAFIGVIDSGKFRLRAFIESLMYSFTAPTMRDGDAKRGISKISLEARNCAGFPNSSGFTGYSTGDAGQASMLIRNITP